MHDLFVGGNVVPIVGSTVWSVISMLLSHVRCLAIKKQFQMSVRYAATRCFCSRVAKVVRNGPKVDKGVGAWDYALTLPVAQLHQKGTREEHLCL